MGSARIDQNFTFVNEHATLDGVVYFFSFEFTTLLTLLKDHYYIGNNSLFKGKRKRVIINSMKRNLVKRLFLECENGHGK